MSHDIWADSKGQPKPPQHDRQVAPDDEGGATWWKGGMTTALHPELLLQGLDQTLSTEVASLIGLAARSVAYLELTFDGGRADGTGFLIAPDFLLTNHHNVVNEDYGDVRALTAHFDREETFTGPRLEVGGQLPPVAKDEAHDWAVIRLEHPVTDRVPIALDAKAPILRKEPVLVIQHPQGRFKRWAVGALVYADDDVVQYLADTQKGSSGSPVFNGRMHCLGLHHAEAEVEVEREGRRQKVFCNQGIRIERVIEGLTRAKIPFDEDPQAFIGRLRAQPGVKGQGATAKGPPTVIISYNHKDEIWKDRLATQLKVLEKLGLLEPWDDRRIRAGDAWRPAIQAAMDRAAVAIMLISADYLTSDFVQAEELPRLLQRREREGLRVIPLIVRPCPWKLVPWLKEIEPWPKDAKEGRALAARPSDEVDEQLAALAYEIADIVGVPGAV